MKNRFNSVAVTALIALVGSTSVNAKSQAVYEADQYEVLPIENSDGKDISGLSACNGKLIAVSDKDKAMLYSLEESGHSYSLTEYKKIEPAKHQGVEYEWKHRFKSIVESFLHDDPLDYEGIACNGDGSVYIVSENHASILSFSENESKQPNWLNGGIYTDGRAQGYFGIYNAFLEGITAHGNRLRLAIERQQRGIVDVSLGEGQKIESLAFREIPNNLELDFSGRPEDVTGLTEDENYIYTLERNASAVCRRDNDTYQAVDCVTFKKAEQDIKYADKRYGKSEGLAILNGMVYVVLDNNGDNVDGTEDRRGRLIRFKAPTDWGEE